MRRHRANLHKTAAAWEEIARVDFLIRLMAGSDLAASSTETSLRPEQPSAPKLPAAAIAVYRDRTWVTRPRPHVDRLAVRGSSNGLLIRRRSSGTPLNLRAMRFASTCEARTSVTMATSVPLKRWYFVRAFGPRLAGDGRDRP